MCDELNRQQYALFFLLFFVANFLYGQNLTTEEHNKKIATLSDKEKVDYIIDNYYTLYSADFDNALKVTSQAAVIARANRWKDKEAYAEMFQGVITYLKGDFQNALPRYLRAYTIFDSLKHYDGLARLSNEMAVFYRKQSDTKTAYRYLDQSEQFALLANNKTELGTSYAHRAPMLEAEGKVEEAIDLYQKVYQIRSDAKDSVGLGYALLDLSSIALRKNDLKKALDYIQQSTAIRKKIGDLQGVAVNLVNTGETYYSIKDYRNAITYFKQCLEIATRIGYSDLVHYTYEQLAAAHVNLNDYKNAFHYQAKGNAYKDSLFTIDKTKVIADLQTKYETEKKEQQINLQKAQLEERDLEILQTRIIVGALLVTVVLIAIIFALARGRYKRKQELLEKEKEILVREAFMAASIESQENERKRFAQDLHDGMGQLISALRLLLEPINRDMPLQERFTIVEKAEKLLNDMHQEIRSIAFNLMPQTLVQYGLVPALKEMADRMNSSGKISVRITSFDLPQRLSEVQEISLYRIVQEWINNIVKYAGAFNIEVQLIGHEVEINVTIEDDGTGFDTQKLYGTGNGWKNIRSRLNLIKGSVEIDSEKGRKGTTLIIRIPLKALSPENPPVIAAKG